MPLLPSCPGCGSDLVQPQGCQVRDGGELLVELRCPECYAVMQASHTASEMEELDRRQTASREQILAAYEAAVSESMQALARSLGEALARDLVGPDDFSPPRRRRPRGPGSLPRAA